MKDRVMVAAVRVVLPPLLGGLGALAATMLPEYYTAVCGARLAALGSGLL